jgi:hypothetical protein
MTNFKEFNKLNHENVLTYIEGNAWNDNPNPFARIATFFIKLISILFGIKKRSYLVVTDKRVVQIDKNKVFWFITVSVGVFSHNKSTIQTVGWEMASAYLFFKKYYLIIVNHNQRLKITYKGGKLKLEEDCKILDSILTQSI